MKPSDSKGFWGSVRPHTTRVSEEKDSYKAHTFSHTSEIDPKRNAWEAPQPMPLERGEPCLFAHRQLLKLGPAAVRPPANASRNESLRASMR